MFSLVSCRPRSCARPRSPVSQRMTMWHAALSQRPSTCEISFDDEKMTTSMTKNDMMHRWWSCRGGWAARLTNPMSVCLSVCVCLFAVNASEVTTLWRYTNLFDNNNIIIIISSELQVQSSPNVLCMLPSAVARSSSSGVVASYVLPVLWITSYLLTNQGCSTSPPS